MLRASRRKWSLLLAVLVASVAAGVLMVSAGTVAMGWVTIVLFGAGVVIAVWELVSPGTLVVTPTTITFRRLGARYTRDLVSCSEFVVWHKPNARQDLLAFDHPADVPTPLGQANSAVAGRSTTLPETYGMRADELAALLNHARAGALASSTDPVATGRLSSSRPPAAYVRDRPRGKAVASMVIGIVAATTWLVAPLAILCGVVAVVLAVQARRGIRRGTYAGAGQAIAGLVCGIIGIVVGVAVLPAFISGWNAT